MTKQWISQRVDLLGVMNQMEDQLQLIPGRTHVTAPVVRP